MKGRKWDNCNSIINKYIKKKKELKNLSQKRKVASCSELDLISLVLQKVNSIYVVC